MQSVKHMKELNWENNCEFRLVVHFVLEMSTPLFTPCHCLLHSLLVPSIASNSGTFLFHPCYGLYAFKFYKLSRDWLLSAPHFFWKCSSVLWFSPRLNCFWRILGDLINKSIFKLISTLFFIYFYLCLLNIFMFFIALSMELPILLIILEAYSFILLKCSLKFYYFYNITGKTFYKTIIEFIYYSNIYLSSLYWTVLQDYMSQAYWMHKMHALLFSRKEE